MKYYILLAVIIRFLVDFMLILAINRLFIQFESPVRGLLGGAVGALYAAACMLPMLQHPVWYFLSLLLTSAAAFGVCTAAIRQIVVFCLLRLGLDSLGWNQGSVREMTGLLILCGVCLWIFFGSNGIRRMIPVQLSYGGKQVKLCALLDSGHDLRDPVTGKPVLIVGADVADRLTGLTAQQLRRPVETMGAIPGLRLIPYQTVDSSGNMLLAMQLPEARIGRKKGSFLVAFAPQVLDGKGQFQALIGGNV